VAAGSVEVEPEPDGRHKVALVSVICLALLSFSGRTDRPQAMALAVELAGLYVGRPAKL
jgi:hypothetical protein